MPASQDSIFASLHSIGDGVRALEGRYGPGLPIATSSGSLGARMSRVKAQIVAFRQDLQAARADLQVLMAERGTAGHDMGHASSRIETLEYEWTEWSTGWDTSKEQSTAPSPPGAFTAGLATQPRAPNQGRSGGPEEFQLTPRLVPRYGEEGQFLDPLQEWWENRSLRDTLRALGPPEAQAPHGGVPDLQSRLTAGTSARGLGWAPHITEQRAKVGLFHPRRREEAIAGSHFGFAPAIRREWARRRRLPRPIPRLALDAARCLACAVDGLAAPSGAPG